MTNQELIVLIIKSILAVLSIVLTYYIVPWLKSMYDTTTDEKFKEFVNRAVRAAEQTFKEEKSGPKKKEYVMRCAKKWLSDNGLDLPDEALNALIESLVYDLNSAKEVILHD